MDVDALATELAARRRARFWEIADPRTVAEWVFGDAFTVEPVEAFPGAADLVDQARNALRQLPEIGAEPVALGLAGLVIRATVPEAARIAGTNWLVTVQGGSVDKLARVTLGISEVAILKWGSDYLDLVLRLAASPIDEALASGSLSSSQMADLGIERIRDGLRSFADDVARYFCPTSDAAEWFLDQPAVIAAARLMNARLVADGRFLFAADYDPELAARVWAAAEAMYFTSEELPDVPEVPSVGFDRPYRGKPAEGDYPEIQATSPAARERANAEHDALCRQLIAHLARSGIEAGELTSPPVDVAWHGANNRQVIAEIKSCVDGNDVAQLRLGLGQLLEYRQRLVEAGKPADAILLVTRVKDPIWYEICRAVDVLLLAGDEEASWDLSV